MIAALLSAVSFFFGLVVMRRLRVVDGWWAEFAGAWIVGIFVSTWLCFLLSFLFSFTQWTVLVTAVALAGAAIWLMRKSVPLPAGDRPSFGWAEGVALVLVAPFFIWGIWQDQSGGVFYVGNFTDIPFHLAMVSSFVQQDAFLPDYPQVAGAKLCYHFLINFHTAMLEQGGLNLLNALWIDQIFLGLCLALLPVAFFRRAGGKQKGVAMLAVLVFWLAHAGVFNLAAAMGGVPVGGKLLPPAGASWEQARHIFLFPFFNFLFPLMNFFMPQRPFLFAFSAACLLLCALIKIEQEETHRSRRLAFVVAGVVAMPLFHLHTFLVSATALLLLVAVRRRQWKPALLCLLGLLPALPQLLFLLSQPMSAGARGFDVHLIPALREVDVFGSMVLSRLVYWVRAAGMPFVLGWAGLIWAAWKVRDGDWPQRSTVLWLTLPGLLFFAVINVYRMTPSWGDSNKFYLYLHLFFSLYIAWLFALWWKRGAAAKAGVVALLLLAGVLPSLMTLHDFWKPRVVQAVTDRRAHAQIMFTTQDIACAHWVMQQTPSDAVLLTTDDVIHVLPALTGRRVVNGAYTATNGLMRPGVKEAVAAIYRTGSREVARRWHVDYIFLGRREQSKYNPDRLALASSFKQKQKPGDPECVLYEVP